MTSKQFPSLSLLRYVGVLLFIVLIVYAGPRRIAQVIQHAQPVWLLVAFLLNIPQLGLKALRWFLLVRWQGLHLAYSRALLAYFGSLLLGFLTPGRLGDMAKAITLKYESGTSLAHGLSSVIMDRVFDLYLLLTIGTIAIIRFAVVGSVLSWSTFVGICILSLLPLFLLHPQIARWAGQLLVHLVVVRRQGEMLNERVNQFATGLEVLTPVRILQCAGLTIASYLLFFLQCLCCAWALNFGVRFLDLALLMSATNFFSLLPITVSGLGTREACLIYFLARVQPPQPVPTAVTFGMALFLVLFVGGGLIGLISWQYAPIGLQQALRDHRSNRE